MNLSSFRAAAAALALAASATVASAQTLAPPTMTPPPMRPTAAPAPSPAAPAAAPVIPSVPYDKLTPSHIALGKELAEITGITQTFKLYVPQLFDQLGRNITRTRPELAADLRTSMVTLLPEFEGRTSEMVDETAKALASTITEPELKDIIAFFKTPSGKKYIDMQPPVMQRVVLGIERWNNKLAEEMATRVREELKKKGHQL